MPNANLQTTAPLRKKNLYGEAMKKSSKESKKRKTYYDRAVPEGVGISNYTAKG